MMIWQ